MKKTNYVYETTNILFAIENRGGVLKKHWEIVKSTENYISSISFRKLGMCVVKYNCDPPCLSAKKTIVQYSKSFR